MRDPLFFSNEVNPVSGEGGGGLRRKGWMNRVHGSIGEILRRCLLDFDRGIRDRILRVREYFLEHQFISIDTFLFFRGSTRLLMKLNKFSF